MRTTVNIDERLLALAKRRAHEQHKTLGQVVEEALQRHLGGAPTRSGPPLPVFRGGGGLRPGIDWRSNASMYDAMDEAPDRERA